MTLKKLIRTIVLPLLMVGQVVTPTYSSAQMKETGREAQSFGQNLAESLKNAGQGYSNGSLDIGGGNSVKIDDLFPGTSSSNTKPSSYYFPDNTNGSPSSDNLEGLYNSSSGMNDKGQIYGDALLQDSKSESPSLSGAAYQILRNQALLPKEKFYNDPMLNQSKDVYENMDLIAAGFGDCKVQDNITQGDKDVHMPDYRVCNVLANENVDCKINHDWKAGVIEHYSGPVNLDSCGEGCMDFWIGRVGDNYWSGYCSIFEQTTAVTVLKPGAIESAVLEYVKFDDYIQVFINGEKVYNGPNENFPPETDGACELNTSWSQYPNVDVTSFFKNIKEGDVVEFKIRVSVAGEGEGFGRIKIKFDPKKALSLDEWVSQNKECFDGAQAYYDQFGKGSVSCVDMPVLDADGCTVSNGVRLCESDFGEPPVKGLSPLCNEYKVTVDGKFNVGQMDCWIDPQGEEQCPYNDGEIKDSCVELENDSSCGFISESCVEGGQGDSGKCYVVEKKYDCGYGVKIPNYTNNSSYQCGGEIKCMGDECLDLGRESSEDFAKAAGLLNAAQMMAQDMSCTGLDSEGDPTGTDNVTCKVFSGTAGTCKIAVGGVQNCCKKPDNISLADYIMMLRAIPKLDGAIVNMADGSLVKGTYQTFRDPLVKGWTEVTKPFASYGENISGAVKEFVSPIKEVYNQVIDQFKSKVQEVISKAISNGLQSTGMGSGAAAGVADQVGKEAADKAASEIMANIGNAASTIMTIYTVYVVTMMLIQIIWACEQEEFEMNAKRQLKSCHYVGSYCKTKVVGACIEKREAYCCFNSPLSRIINEQVRSQKGWGFGSPKNPQCDGLTLDQIAEVDWDKIDLTEWLGILQETGHYPDDSTMSMDKLTGSGSILNVDGTRLNSQERAEQRMDGIDLDRIRTDAEKTIMIPK